MCCGNNLIYSVGIDRSSGVWMLCIGVEFLPCFTSFLSFWLLPLLLTLLVLLLPLIISVSSSVSASTSSPASSF